MDNSKTTNWPALHEAAETLKQQFRELNAEWFVDDCKNDGPCDMTPWNILAEVAIMKYLEKTDGA
jgi:hypothetical protein